MTIIVKDVIIQHTQNTILKNINFTVEKGEFIYLIGKTGSGKSSILKTLYAALPLTNGTAQVVGHTLQDIRSKNIPDLRRKIGIIFQDFQLLTDRTVHENLKFVLKATGWKKKEDINKRIQSVLQLVGIEAKEHKMPFELSGGEQQRIVIARALLNEPELILADEPTGNLDPETSEQILNLLIEISRQGKAVIMATHNIELVQKYPNRTLTCSNNTLIESTEKELSIKEDGVFTDFIDTPQEGSNL